MTTCGCVARTAILDLLNRYSTCLDERDWSGLEDVFHPDARGHYGSLIEGRSAIIASIRTFLGGCGRIINRHFDVRISTGDIGVLHPG
jgi:SnoaL-like domain